MYVLNGIWPASGPVPPKEDVIGAISAIVWSLTFLPLLKYVSALFAFSLQETNFLVNVTRSLFVCVLARTKVWAAQQYFRLSIEPIAYNWACFRRGWNVRLVSRHLPPEVFRKNPYSRFFDGREGET